MTVEVKHVRLASSQHTSGTPPLLLFGSPNDVCSADGCDTVLRGSNPDDVCALHERIWLTRPRERRKTETTDVSRRHVSPRVSAAHHDHGDDLMTTKERILQMITEADGRVVKRPDDISKGTWGSSVFDLKKKGHRIVAIPGLGYRLETNDNGKPPTPEALPPATCGADGKVRAGTEDDWRERAARLLGTAAHPRLWIDLADCMASENASRKVSMSRVVRELYEPLAALAQEVGAPAMEHGLRAAIKAGAPNATYVRKAVRGYKEEGPLGAPMSVEEFSKLHDPCVFEDGEISAIAEIVRAVYSIHPEGRTRVLAYIHSRYIDYVA